MSPALAGKFLTTGPPGKFEKYSEGGRWKQKECLRRFVLGNSWDRVCKIHLSMTWKPLFYWGNFCNWNQINLGLEKTWFFFKKKKMISLKGSIDFVLKEKYINENTFWGSNQYWVSLKLSIQKTKIMSSGPITSWQKDGETVETVTDFIFLGSKITADGDYSHEIKRNILLGRKAVTNLDSMLKSRDLFS